MCYVFIFIYKLNKYIDKFWYVLFFVDNLFLVGKIYDFGFMYIFVLKCC